MASPVNGGPACRSAGFCSLELAPGVGRVFETDDMELAEQLLSDAYAGLRIDAQGRRRGLRMTCAMAGLVRFDRITFAMNAQVRGMPLGSLIFGRLASGRASQASGGSERRYRADDAFLVAQPEHPYTAQTEDGDFELAVMPSGLPSRVAATAPGPRQQPVRFTGYEPVSPQAARLWTSTHAYVRDTVLADPDAAAHPLVSSSAARLLVAVTLVVFPSNALTAPTASDRRDAHGVTVRRAIAFIDENAHADIAVADIAAAAHVTIRTIQLAFRRHLDMTPMQYLRRVRLDHARHELLAADSARVTVTDVAYRWGFPSPSRFSSYYREAYGSTPGQALRQD
jgi:AraC-like DNA-binding protein